MGKWICYYRDSVRGLLFIGSNLWVDKLGYYPNIIRSYNISNIFNITQIAHQYRASYAWATESVVLGNGRVLFIDYEFTGGSGWVGSYDPWDLSFGFDWSIPTSLGVAAFQHIPDDHAILLLGYVGVLSSVHL